MRNFYPLLGVSSPFDPWNLHVTSPVLAPLNLALLRLTIAVYTLVTVIITLVHDCVVENSGSSYLSFFTHLTYIGICAYFWAAGIQTWVFARRFRARERMARLRSEAVVADTEKKGGECREDPVMYPLQSWPRPLQALHVWLQVTVHVFPLLVTIVYWGLLASSNSFSTPYKAYSNISIHILNTGFALTDILLSHSPPAPWMMLLLVFPALAGYLAVAYITYAAQGIYPYAFLDPEHVHGFLAVYIVGIAVAYCIIFLLVRGIVVVRSGGLRKLRWGFWRGEQRAGPLGVEDLEDWEEVEVPGRERRSVSSSK